MEENSDSKKVNNEEETSKEDSLIDNENKNESNLVNNISIPKNIGLNNQDKTNEVNNKNLNPLGKNNETKDSAYEKGDEKNTNTSIKDINNVKVLDQSESSNVSKIKPKKEIPIEKKPFNEFVNDHLFPSLIKEFGDRGFEVEVINLKNTSRPIAGDKCWVIYFEIKDICNFWLSFERDDITSLKSISLCKTNQKPSVIESFLIDEKRITLKLIISRILQRLNGQKLIGIN